MSKNDRANKAINRVYDEGCVEEIFEVDECPDFVDIFGRIGGDSVHLRVYDDGTIGEK